MPNWLVPSSPQERLGTRLRRGRGKQDAGKKGKTVRLGKSRGHAEEQNETD